MEEDEVLVEMAVSDLKPQPRDIETQDILHAAIEEFVVTREELVSSSRAHRIALPRTSCRKATRSLSPRLASCWAVETTPPSSADMKDHKPGNSGPSAAPAGKLHPRSPLRAGRYLRYFLPTYCRTSNATISERLVAMGNSSCAPPFLGSKSMPTYVPDIS